MSYKVIDLFCGAGGLSLGFSDRRFCGGFKSILALDNDKASTETYKSNFGDHVICGDVELYLSSNLVPKADVVIGGPPCQGFSLLNKNRHDDERRALWEPFLEIAHKSASKIFVMENVAELRRSPEFDAIVLKAREYGFSCEGFILNSADYGAPQTRKRTIIIGSRHLDLLPSIPLPTHAAPGEASNLPKWRTVRDVIADLPKPTKIEITGSAPLNLHIKRTPTAKSIARYKAVPPGGNRFDLQKNAPEITPNCWIKKKSGGTDLFGRLWWDRPSVTIRTEFFKPEKGRYLHPEQHRPITHREAARLMGFPDDFEFVGSKTEIAKQIGNAVPPAFAGAIAASVKMALDNQSRSGRAQRQSKKRQSTKRKKCQTAA